MNRKLALAFAAAFAALAASVLAFGYPHEDAYILFKYARHVGAGMGSVFSPGGSHAEGATDFLWMMALGVAARAHVDPAIAAAALNTAGYALVVWRVERLFAAEAPELAPRVRFGLVVVAGVLFLVHPFAAAGALGFSATLYAALGLELYAALALGAFARVPVLAIVLALLRPDGVLLGGAATLVALWQARSGAVARTVLARSVVVAAIGIVYFVARYCYFGQLLPLPLVVKSHYQGRPPGIDEALDWCASTVLPVVGMLAFFRVAFGRVASAPRAAWVALVPFAIHVLGFVPAFPSQNVANRFQSPDALVLYVFALVVAARAIAASPATWRTPAVALAFAGATWFQGYVGVRAMREAFTKDYVNPFSVELGVIARARTAAGKPPLRVASTEAGRILYWTNGPVVDLVGLNTAETAFAPPSRELLARFDPDVVMFHHASGLDEDAIEREAGPAGKSDVFRIAPPLARYVRPWNAAFLAPDVAPYAALRVDNVRVAPIATAAFLDDHAAEYELWAARFVARFARLHVYAIRASLPEKEAILRELIRAHDPANHGSHLHALSRE